MYHYYILLSGATAWTIAQLIKVIIDVIRHNTKNLKIRQAAWRSGGMPSSHSAVVTAVIVGAARQYGVYSTPFALVLFWGFIVIYDALGVRRQAGEHAKMLNKINLILQNKESNSPEEVLYELIGHTPVQVLAGIITGAAVGAVYWLTW